jgi:predicted ATPase
VDGQDWHVFYALEIRAPKTSNPDNPYSRTGSSHISHETIRAKLNGVPGRPTLLLKRETDGKTTAVPEQQKRRRLRFDSKRDMSAMQALEIREAGNFQHIFPVLAHFRSGLLASSMIRLSPESVFSRQTETSRYSGPAIHKFASLFAMLQQIQSDPAQWDELSAWVKTLCGIDRIELETKPFDEKDASQKTVRQFMLLYQGPFMLLPEELSTGTKILLSLVTNLFHQRHLPGVILIEEPEMCVHPGAIVALIHLFRDFSQRSTILFSTHSPVALNSMNPNEVSVLVSAEDGFYTTQLVSSIAEAVKALERGFLSFGDLLQTNFTTNPDTE